MIELNTENFEKEVLHSEKLIIIDFWSQKCIQCKVLAPVLEELEHDYKGKLKFAKLNVAENMQIAEKYGVLGLPTLILAEKGKEIGRITGFSPAFVLKGKIDFLMEKANLAKAK